MLRQQVLDTYAQTSRSVQSQKIDVRSSPFTLEWVVHPPESVQIGKMFEVKLLCKGQSLANLEQQLVSVAVLPSFPEEMQGKSSSQALLKQFSLGLSAASSVNVGFNAELDESKS